MPGTTSPASHPLWLLLAAMASLVGSAALLKMGRAAEGVAAASGGGPAALGLYSLVILLGLAGLVLAAMAAKEYLDSRRQSQLG
jgi:hypothetical protein